MLNGYIPVALARDGRAVLGTTIMPEWKGHFALTGRTGQNGPPFSKVQCHKYSSQTELNWSVLFDFQPKCPEFEVEWKAPEGVNAARHRVCNVHETPLIRTLNGKTKVSVLTRCPYLISRLN